MERSLDFTKQVLTYIEQSVPFGHTVETYNFYHELHQNTNVVEYHLKLLKQGNYIDYYIDGKYMTISLTWEGHELLDAMKNEGAWNKLKSKFKEQGSNLPFEVSKNLLVQYIKSQFGAE